MGFLPMRFLFYFTYLLCLPNICENLRSSADNKKRCIEILLPLPGRNCGGHGVTALPYLAPSPLSLAPRHYKNTRPRERVEKMRTKLAKYQTERTTRDIFIDYCLSILNLSLCQSGGVRKNAKNCTKSNCVSQEKNFIQVILLHSIIGFSDIIAYADYIATRIKTEPGFHVGR